MLDKVRFNVRRVYSAEFIDSLHFDARIDDVADDILMTLEATLRGRKIREETVSTEKVPRDWIEAIKERWAPKWFLRRHPVLYRHIDTRRIVHHVCPHVGTDQMLCWNFLKGEKDS